MLKLRKNKKGFTLVELIVVIAIMAVLAGTVAGVTISQLNKQTNNSALSEVKTLMSDFQTFLLTYEGTITDAASGTTAVGKFADEAKATDGKSVFTNDTAKAGDHVFKYEVTESGTGDVKTVTFRFYADQVGSTGPVPEISWVYNNLQI